MSAGDGGRAYPVTRPGGGDSDARFTFGLALDVGEVLEAHGYPPVSNGHDFVELQAALFRFIYGPVADAGRPGWSGGGDAR